MMKSLSSVLLLALACPALAATVAFESDLSQSTEGWTVSNYANSILFETCEVSGQPALKLTRRVLECDSAWGFKSKPFEVREGGFSVAIDVCSTVPRLPRSGACSNPQWGCYIAWLDENGEMAYPARTYSLAVNSNSWTTVKFGGDVPRGAKKAVLSIAADAPKIRKDEFVAFGKVAVKLYPPALAPCHRVTLRDDGMTLIGGKPFFPIGMYSVSPCKHNGNSMERAIEELKEIGFNMIHTYGTRDAATLRKTLETIERFGMKTFIPAGSYHGKLDVDRVMEFRGYPSVLAWYLDDDTSLHASPETLIMRNLACRELDDSRLTCQADTPDSYGTRYSAYVNGADVYLPEIYPVHSLQPRGSEVAKVGMHMEHIAAANRYARAPVKGTWAILQHFDGWDDWMRFPTLDELRATSFAALVHRARGYTLYCYGRDLVDCAPAEWKKKNPGWWAGRGCASASAEEHWDEMCTVIREIAPLAEDLASRDAEAQPKVEITDGPKKDMCGGSSVSCLVKETGLFMAVNSTTNAVSASFTFARRTGDKVFQKTFAPYEVVVKRLKQGN